MSTVEVEGMAFGIICESGNVVDVRERNEETMSVYCFSTWNASASYPTKVLE